MNISMVSTLKLHLSVKRVEIDTDLLLLEKGFNFERENANEYFFMRTIPVGKGDTERKSLVDKDIRFG